MAKNIVLTTSGAAKASSGNLHVVNITKVATGTGSVIIYDNASAASGPILFQGDGLVQNSFQLNDGNGGSVQATNGIYVSLGGSTNATVNVLYD